DKALHCLQARDGGEALELRPVLPERTRRRQRDTDVGVAPSLVPVAHWARPKPCPCKSAYMGFAGMLRRDRATFRRAGPRPSGDDETVPALTQRRPAGRYNSH